MRLEIGKLYEVTERFCSSYNLSEKMEIGEILLYVGEEKKREKIDGKFTKKQIIYSIFLRGRGRKIWLVDQQFLQMFIKKAK